MWRFLRYDRPRTHVVGLFSRYTFRSSLRFFSTLVHFNDFRIVLFPIFPCSFCLSKFWRVYCYSLVQHQFDPICLSEIFQLLYPEKKNKWLVNVIVEQVSLRLAIGGISISKCGYNGGFWSVKKVRRFFHGYLYYFFTPHPRIWASFLPAYKFHVPYSSDSLFLSVFF